MTKNTFTNALEEIVEARSNLITNNTMDIEDKKSKLSLLDKENDELNQSLDIFFRLEEYSGFQRFQELLDFKANISELPDFASFSLKDTLPDFDTFVLSENLPDFDTFVLSENLPDFDTFSLKTELPNLTPYALKNELPNLTPYALKSDLHEIPDLTNYALKTDIPSSADLTSYALKTDLPNLTPYALKTNLPNLTPYALKTQLPNLALYALKTDIPSSSNGVTVTFETFNIDVSLTNLTTPSSSNLPKAVIDSNGYLTLSGLVRNCSPSELLIQLPTNFRPIQELFIPMCTTDASPFIINIKRGGQIYILRVQSAGSIVPLNLTIKAR